MASTFINLPPPPSDPVTPSDMGPGTPNSGTTSLSALSTTAIKDGHQGQAPHAHQHRHTSSNSSNASTTTLDAERADRISRLAGLERVATVRQAAPANISQGMTAGTSAVPLPSHPVGYFDHAGNPVLAKERSTVGSASATGSAGGRTTWASGSDMYEVDKMSEDNDAVSSGGLSDEGNASLVGFGEGANSTVDGPVSNPPPGAYGYGSGTTPTSGNAPSRMIPKMARPDAEGLHGGAGLGAEKERAKMIDGVTYDRDVVDTTARSPLPAGIASAASLGTGSNQGTPAPRHAGLSGRETAERIVQERFGRPDGDVNMTDGYNQ